MKLWSKVNRIGLCMLLVCVMALSVVGCSQKPKEPQKPAEQPPASTPAPAPAPAPAPKESLLRAAGGSTGGLYYVFTTAWSKLIESKVPGTKIQIEATGGSIANLRLLSEATADIGLTSTVQYEIALNKTDWAKDADFTKLRALFPVYPSPITIFSVKGKGIKSLNDLNGKIVCPGPKQAGGDIFLGRIMQLYGIKPKSIVNANFSDLVQILKDGQADVAIVEGGHPHSTASELEQTHQVEYYEMSPEEVKKISETFPAYQEIKLGEGLKYMKPGTRAVTTWSYAAVKMGFSEDLAYQITKLSWENQSDLLAAVAAAKDMKTENIEKLNIPLHPGAIKYYKEKGISVPDKLIPPEYKK
ncbi:MAG: TAXI family TRAP transporter solute-binding subunit [Ignavibacteriales bacterium]